MEQNRDNQETYLGCSTDSVAKRDARLYSCDSSDIEQGGGHCLWKVAASPATPNPQLEYHDCMFVEAAGRYQTFDLPVFPFSSLPVPESLRRAGN
jgi:hypothetical protein